MKIVLFYHSTTGNTKLAALRIARGLHFLGAECHVINAATVNRDEAANLVAWANLVGFGSPVHAWKPTAVIRDFISALPTQSGKAAFVFCTAGGQPSNSLFLLGEAAKARGFVPIAGHDMTAEDTWPILRAYLSRWNHAGRPNDFDIRALDLFVQHLFALISRSLGGESIVSAQFPFTRDWMYVLGRLVTAAWLRRGTGRKTVDPARCTLCGHCARTCPVKAIQLAPYPTFDQKCVGCWACYHNCPEQAIGSSLLRGRDGHYSGPDWTILAKPWPLT